MTEDPEQAPRRRQLIPRQKMESQVGVVTRARQRQRSQSKEPAPANALPGRAKSAHNAAMEAVPENGNSDSILSTPSSQPSSQKSQVRNGHKNGVNGVHDKTPSSSQNSSPRPLSPTSMSRIEEKAELQKLNNRLAVLLDKLNESNNENGVLKALLAQKEGQDEALLESQLEMYREQVRKLSIALDQESNEKVGEILARERLQVELDQLKNSMVGLQGRVDDAETRARNAERMQREGDRKLTDAEIALNEANLQKNMLKSDLEKLMGQFRALQADLEKEVATRAALQNELNTVKETAEFELKLAVDKMKRQAVPLDAVDSSSARRSFQDVNINRMREQFQEDMDAAREEIEDQLAEMYQRKLDDMGNQLRMMDQDLQHQQQSAASANKSYREIAQQLAAVQKANRDWEDELSRLRDEYDNYKEQAEQRMYEMSSAIRENSARYQQVIEENKELVELHASIAAEMKTYDALISGEEARVGITPERRAALYSRGHKRKRPEASLSALTASASRVNSVARPRSSHSQTTLKASANKSRSSGEIRILELDPGKVIRIENTGDKATDISGCVLAQLAPGEEEVKYVFEAGASIAGKGVISIYGPKGAGDGPHDGPMERVAQTDWLESRTTAAYLRDPHGKELANYESVCDVDVMSNGSQNGGVSRQSSGWLQKIFGSG